MTRERVHEIQVDLIALRHHLADSRRLDPHEVETVRRRLLEAVAAVDQFYAAAALCGVLHQQLELIDRARPGAPVR